LLLLLLMLLCNCCDAAAADASEAISGERSQRYRTSAKPDAGFIVRRRTVSRTHITTICLVAGVRLFTTQWLRICLRIRLLAWLKTCVGRETSKRAQFTVNKDYKMK